MTGLILLSKGLWRIFSSTTVWKHWFFGAQHSLWSNSHIHTWLLEITITLTKWTFVSKEMSLLFNTLSRFIIAFLSKSKHLLISWLQSWTAVTLSITNLIKEIRKKKSLDPGSLCHLVIIYLNISYKHRKSPHSLKSVPFLKNSQWKQNLIAIEYLSGSEVVGVKRWS